MNAGGRGLSLQSRWSLRGWITTGITFNVKVSGSFVSSTVAAVSAHVALCCLLDDQHMFLAIRFEGNVLGGKDFFAIFEPFDLSSGLTQLAGQNHLIFLNSGVILELHCEVQVALCGQTPGLYQLKTFTG